jgi:localization factor PodJL
MDRQGYQRAAPRAGAGETAGASADHGKFHDRLDEIAARLDRLARRAQTRGPASPDDDIRPGAPESAVRGRGPRLDEPVADAWTPEARREPARPTAGPSFSLDDAIAEISARQEALETDAAEPAAAPAVDLSGVERLLHNITDQIDTLRRPSTMEESIEALRRELADIGRAVAEPRPQPSLDAVQAELRALVERIDRPRAPVELPALSAIERGLNEVRDALNARPSLPAATALNDDAPAFARTGPDAATLDHLDSAIAELRNVSTRVASGDQLAALASDVRTLGAKLDRVAPSAAPPDGMEDLLRRMDALAVALETHPRPNEPAEGGQIEAQLRRLTDKLDTVEVAADQRGFKQIEAQLARLTQKLDAADARLGHLDTIEHAVADLVEQLQDARVGALDAAEQAARSAVREMMGASAGADVDVLKHELADFRATQADIDRRTQDMLETLQSTLERLVDRMSAIETDLPAIAVGRAAEPIAPIAPAPVYAPPPPSIERRPVDTGLPADHPLEPGTGAPRPRAPTPAERIAASEALLPPRPTTEPAGKANFIAAARRAARAAAADASWEGTRASDERPRSSMLGSVGDVISKRRRPLMIGIGVLLLVLGTFQLVSNFLASRQPSEAPHARENPPAVAPSNSPAPKAVTPLAPPVVPPAPERRSENAPTDTSAAKTLPAAEAPKKPAEERAPREPKASAIAPLPAVPAIPNITIPPEVTGSTAATPPAVTPPAIAAAPPIVAPVIEKPPPAEIGLGLRSAALAGNPAAEYELALRYTEGRGVAPSREEAVRWLERAANHGLAPAQYRLGSLYEKGQGVKKDLEAARRLYTAAASKGNAKAMHNLAVLYAEGISSDPDYRNAAHWFRKAADRGIPDSQYNLGILYARGIGVEANLAESYKWFALAAQQGDKDANKKRDDVAARLDAQSLAAARAAVQSFTAEPQPAEAVEVKPPPGGWEKPAAAPHAPKVKPPAGAPRKLTPA